MHLSPVNSPQCVVRLGLSLVVLGLASGITGRVAGPTLFRAFSLASGGMQCSRWSRKV